MEIFNDYKHRHTDKMFANQGHSQRSEHMGKFEQYNTLDDLDKGNELELYLRGERVPRHIDPLRWWEVKNERYPILQHLAFNTLA